MLAPAIAPWEVGRHELKYRWSPPVKWKYGIIVMLSDELIVDATRMMSWGALSEAGGSQ
jgi:hypothetical protein